MGTSSDRIGVLLFGAELLRNGFPRKFATRKSEVVGKPTSRAVREDKSFCSISLDLLTEQKQCQTKQAACLLPSLANH